MAPPSSSPRSAPQPAAAERRQARVPRVSPVRPPADAAADAAAGPLLLIAEDHADSRDALRTLLVAFGYRVLEAEDGQRAVELALEQKPDLVLLDMMMPVLDGFQAAREIRRHEALREVPILALSAVEGARDRILAAGVDELLPKPLDIRVLLARLQHWLGSRATGR